MPDPVAVNSMFARIARRYDLTNRLLSGGVDVWWRWRLVHAVRRGHPQAVLDLATGSGDVAFALARKLPPTTTLLGMDFCQPMLDQALGKRAAHPRYARVDFRQGDGLALPLDSGQFDAVTIAFGLRNMADRQQALREMRRVLRPGGRLYVLEFSQAYRWFRPLYLVYLRRVLPWIAGGVTGDRAAYEYLNASIEAFPDRASLTGELHAAGFAEVQASALALGIVALHEAHC